MSDATARRYADSSVEIIFQNGMAVVRRLSDERYFQVKADKVPSEYFELSRELKPSFPSWLPKGMVFSSLLLYVASVGVSLLPAGDLSAGRYFLLTTVAILAPNIILHECAHLLSLRHCGRKADKVGVKLHYFILPAFYVRMNQSHLIPRSDKIVVHSSGVFASLAINLVVQVVNLVFIRSMTLHEVCGYVVYVLTFNILPILKSDGYRTLLAIMNVNEGVRMRTNPFWLTFLNVLSLILVSIYGIFLFFPLLTEGLLWMK